VESGTWGVPPILRCPLIGGKAGPMERGKGLPLSKWLRKRSLGLLRAREWLIRGS
jgi:hypothetical protein